MASWRAGRPDWRKPEPAPCRTCASPAAARTSRGLAGGADGTLSPLRAWSAYEAASLKARLQDGRLLTLRLSEESVFEDRLPRLADLDGDGSDEIIRVHCYADRGAALAVVGVRSGERKIVAETPQR
jgi:hypothetical protein